MYPVSSNIGLELGAPLKPPFHLYILGQVCLAPLLSLGSCKLFLPRPRPYVMFHGHIVLTPPP